MNAAADIIDTSHADAAFANAQRADEAARRRCLIAISGIATLLGGIGLGALCYGASFLMVKARTELIEVPTVYTETKLIEVPTVYETTKYVVTEKIVEVPAGSKVSARAPNPAELPGKAASPAPLETDPTAPKVNAPKPELVPAPAPKVAEAPSKPNPNEALPDFLKRCQKFGYHLTYCNYLFQHYPSLSTGVTEPKLDAPPNDLTAHGSAWPPLVAWCQARGYGEAVCNDVAGKPATPAPVTRKWDELRDKEYVGRITSVTEDEVCFDRSDSTCTAPILEDPDRPGHVKLDASGHTMRDKTLSQMPMYKWIGFDAYTASDPQDPQHAAHYWVADGTGKLIAFYSEPRIAPTSAANADSVTLTTDGQSLHLEVGLGARTYSYMLDTGASDMTVTKSIADLLVLEGHAIRGESIPVVLADGSRHTEPTIVIDRVTVGSHTVENVVASVSSDNAMMLLGLSVLNRIGPFTVDAPHLTLTFNGAV